MDIDDDLSTAGRTIETTTAFSTLVTELRAGLNLYWATAGRILATCGVVLKPPTEADFSFGRNFFSLLFLYTYRRAGIAPSRRILYAATLQCLRGMVTGCDNLLDDEYKPTLDTDIPAAGHRFRSVVDIMVSDRVLFQILLGAVSRREISHDQVSAATTASMKTMTRSGIEEAGEEVGISAILEPEAILNTIHHFKTGLLFQCPWDIPLTIEALAPEKLAPLLEGLYRIGMGCQILDDMVDMALDMTGRRHNYVVSLVHHGSNAAEKERLTQVMQADRSGEDGAMPAGRFPEAARRARQNSRRLLAEGLGLLFAAEHQALVDPAIRFLEKRIGVDRLFNEAQQ